MVAPTFAKQLSQYQNKHFLKNIRHHWFKLTILHIESSKFSFFRWYCFSLSKFRYVDWLVVEVLRLLSDNINTGGIYCSSEILIYVRVLHLFGFFLHDIQYVFWFFPSLGWVPTAHFKQNTAGSKTKTSRKGRSSLDTVTLVCQREP